MQIHISVIVSPPFEGGETYLLISLTNNVPGLMAMILYPQPVLILNYLLPDA
jgi:hypothetical protein